MGKRRNAMTEADQEGHNGKTQSDVAGFEDGEGGRKSCGMWAALERQENYPPPPQPVERIQLSPHSAFSPVRPVPVRSVTYKAMRR